MKIGKLSSQTGVSIRMLRYYEQEGLLSPHRTEAGYRHYTQEDVAMVKAVLMLNKAGLPLAVVRTLRSCVPSEEAPGAVCEALKAKIRAQIKQLDQQVALLNEGRRLLADLLQ